MILSALMYLALQIPRAVAEATLDIARINREVMVPDQLVREIERWYIADYRKKNAGKVERTEQEILNTIRRRLLDVSVLFQPIRGGAVSNSKRVNLPTGGGIIDFADVLEADRGGFTMDLQLKEETKKQGKVRVFYVSNAKRRVLDDGKYGSDCGRWAEMTSWFARQADPLKLYATEQRHLSVTAGIWVFAHLDDDQLSLAALTLSDSRYPALQCPSTVAKSGD